MSTSHSMTPDNKRAKLSDLHEAYKVYRKSTENQSTPMRKTRSRTKAVKEHFHFLDLPPELRNQIYRLVLVTKHVTKRAPNPAFHDSLDECLPIWCGSPEVDCPTGTIRTHSLLKYRLEYQLQLLRVNRQIYEEASGIFQRENGWVIVNANKGDFGQDLENHGYAVVYRKPYGCKIIEYPVLTISITFSGQHTTGGFNTFILSTAGISQLPRALWTLQQRNLMKIFYESSLDYTNHPRASQKVFRALSRLWAHNILPQSLPPAGRRTHLPNWLPEGVPDSGDVVALELQNARRVIEQYRRDYNAPKAVRLCEKSMTYLSDCYLLYGCRHINTSIATTRTIARRIVGIALLLAEAWMTLREYGPVIKYCSYALTLGDASLGSPGFPQLARVTLVALTRRTKARILLMRGEAYLGSGMRVHGLADNERALELLALEEKGLVRGLREVMFRDWAGRSEEVRAARNSRIAELIRNWNVRRFRRLRISDPENGQELAVDSNP